MSVISERLDSLGLDQDQAADDAVRAMCQFAQRVLAQSKKFFVSECASQAFGIIHHFPGGTKEEYEASIAAVHPSRDKLPEGQAVASRPDGMEDLGTHR